MLGHRLLRMWKTSSQGKGSGSRDDSELAACFVVDQTKRSQAGALFLKLVCSIAMSQSEMYPRAGEHEHYEDSKYYGDNLVGSQGRGKRCSRSAPLLGSPCTTSTAECNPVRLHRCCFSTCSSEHIPPRVENSDYVTSCYFRNSRLRDLRGSSRLSLLRTARTTTTSNFDDGLNEVCVCSGGCCCYSAWYWTGEGKEIVGGMDGLDN